MAEKDRSENKGKRGSEGMDTGKTHAIVAIVISIVIIGTFFAAKTLSKGKNGDFAAVTGEAVGTVNAAQPLHAAIGSVLFGLVAIAALITITRISTSQTMPKTEEKTDIRQTVGMAEDALNAGNHSAAASIYNQIRGQYAQLSQGEKARHYPRIINVHAAIAKRAAISEAGLLTDKYVAGTITEEEFERLGQLVLNQ
ncbi:TPA: hypothetical protein HA231_05530 [Candidatus Woesearchaeota archaeon]|nr:hypothetical protein [Candidatus Woesearchaeota archaeon]